MKQIRTLLLAAIAVVALAATPAANAKIFSWGPRLGVNVNKLSFNKEALNDITDSDNRAGFTGGLMAEFTAPIIGVGMDVSVMYVHRSSEWMAENVKKTANNDYIDIPVNLKWNINLPVVNNIVRPYLATGPSFAFLTSKSALENAYKSRKTTVSWNFGVGVTLVKHLQVGASYGLGLGKAVTNLAGVGSASGSDKVQGKNKYWTVTAAWLF